MDMDTKNELNQDGQNGQKEWTEQEEQTRQQAVEQVKIIEDLNQKRERKKLLYSIGGIFIITVLMLFLSKIQATKKIAAVEKRGGIDSLFIKINEVKEVSGLNEDFDVITSNLDKGLAIARATRKKESAQSSMTTEQKIAQLYAPIGEKERQAWYKELEHPFDVGVDKGFYTRQIKYAKTNLDLAVISGGIINTHKALEGSHRGIKSNGIDEYLKFLRDQVQSAIASNDNRYKTIVFEAIESTGY